MHRNPEVMYKLGVTYDRDVLRRFSKEKAEQYGFANTTLTDDYLITPFISRWVPVEEAKKLEKSFNRVLKKTLWTDVKYNGIGECRILTEAQATQIKQNLDMKYPVDRYGKPKVGYIKVYFIKLVKKVCYENED